MFATNVLFNFYITILAIRSILTYYYGNVLLKNVKLYRKMGEWCFLKYVQYELKTVKQIQSVGMK